MTCNHELQGSKAALIKRESITSESPRGRIQYFYHSPSSELPVRDVYNQQAKGHKTEPHIEIGVENYIDTCRQTNIIAHLNKDEQYLFLVTTCRNKRMTEYGISFIIGYIQKREKLTFKDGRRAIKGETIITSFNESISYRDVFAKRFTPTRLVDKFQAEKILSHFKDKNNILIECVDEIVRLDEKNIKTNKTCLVLRGGTCGFRNECLRWNQ
jgi:hypothetical protein